jgi:hypothetical protein
MQAGSKLSLRKVYPTVAISLAAGRSIVSKFGQQRERGGRHPRRITARELSETDIGMAHHLPHALEVYRFFRTPEDLRNRISDALYCPLASRRAMSSPCDKATA